jgi:hypothetical protein
MGAKVLQAPDRFGASSTEVAKRHDLHENVSPNVLRQ